MTKEEFKELANKHLTAIERPRNARGEQEIAIYGYDDLYEALSIGDVTNSFAIVRWSENENEDIVCANRYVANEYIRKYNKLTGKETLYLDEDTWLPVTEP